MSFYKIRSFIRLHLSQTGFSRQLMVTITVAILLLALFSSFMNSWEASQRLRGNLVEQGQHIVENLARQSTLALLYRSADNAKDGVATTLAFPDVLQVEIRNAANEVLLLQTKSGATVTPIPQSLAAHPVGTGVGTTPGAVLEQETDDEWRFSAPVYVGQSEASPFDVQESHPQLMGYVRVVMGKGTLHRLVSTMMLGNMAISLSFAVILLGMMWLLARHLIKPLNALSSLMGRAEDGESGMRAELAGPRDLVDMASAFNKMMTVLEEREAELTQSRDQAVNTALAKAQFAATVSHEVRTPLNGVVGMLDMLKEMNLTKRQQECVDVAWSSSHALIELINEILDFSKMEAGKLVLEEVEFDLRILVEEVVELLANQAQQKGLELGYMLALDVPEQIRGDPLRIRQVLINLISNAVKFTESGEVAILVTPERNETGLGKLRFAVNDTGIGIEAEAIKHIFDSFVQADRSTTRKYGGTGLGLAICKQLVELMGGKLEVASQRGVGSNFAFKIDYKVSTAPAMTTEDDDRALAGVKVLVVDESEIVRAFLEQTLSRYGMQCTTVHTGREAIEELERIEWHTGQYDLVILDSVTTDEAGDSLIQRIRNGIGVAGLRMLVLDRYGVAADSAPTAEGDITLGKPLRMARVINAIRQLLVAKKSLSTAVSPRMSFSGHPVVEGAKRVLVAEDNRTNQMVAGGMLEMCGYQCDFASNGREAVDLMRRGRFDLILMDCSMPEMDGYEATAHIRNFQEPQGLRVPIIAMTANTQAGDAEKCLAAGMDDYLSKPVTLVELRRKLERWLPQQREQKAVVEMEMYEDAPLDRAVFENLREILGPALQHSLRPFLEDTPTYLKRLEQACRDGDSETARAMAHSIKGSSGNLGALRLAQFSKEVEELASTRNINEIGPLLIPLRRAFNAVAEALKTEISREEQAEVKSGEDAPEVLVVDDDRSTRSALRYTLQRDGFRVQEATDGAQALAMLKRIQPDVILMDAMMPVMDGFTACAKIQELPHGNLIPVLMITALEDNISVERAFAAGASDYIPKPIHFAVLSQRVRRIIEANQAEKRIRHLAHNDLLTGLPNRAVFVDLLGKRIEQARQDGESVGVLFLDLDRFKYVNDTLGHEVGDRLLVAVAQRLRRSVRNGDAVARLGGDEFTVVLTDVAGPAAAAMAAENLCRILATPFQIDGNDIFVKASVGISLYPHDGTDVGTLLKRADTAMYRAKKDSSGFQFFEPAMEQLISDQMRVERDLRHALERGELDVFYQPQAQLESGRVIGMEALVRWHHPTRGLVPPVEFIPLAEETGMINEIGEWVLRTACTQLRTWINEGLPTMRVAVNLSVRQLQQRELSHIVEQVLRDTGLPPHLLELEITESTLMENAQETLETLHQLRSLGIRMSIDDFGTGYSSLAYLKRFPVDTIKIDRSFVNDVSHDADDAAIVTGIIALAHSLRLDVVAEGVETESQLRFLREKGCDMYQGYFLSKPVPGPLFEQFLRDRPRIPSQ